MKTVSASNFDANSADLLLENSFHQHSSVPNALENFNKKDILDEFATNSTLHFKNGFLICIFNLNLKI